MKIYSILIPVLLLYVQQATAQAPAPDFAKSAVQSSRYWIDVDYVGDGLNGHKLDIHLPVSGKAPYPVVVCIYGSAWFSNNAKSTIFHEGLGQRLLKAGFAVVNINHRSSGDAIFPAQIQDVKAAIRFARANAVTFSFDDQFIGVTGFSSGGHLSAMAGASNEVKTKTIDGIEQDIEGHLGKFTATSSRANAVVDWFGPTDFLRMDGCGSKLTHNDPKSPESSLVGGPITENKTKVELANPINYVGKSTAPFLLIHGDSDPLVPLCESVKLYEKLKQEGIQSELITVPGGGHGPGVMIDTYYDRMIAFFTTEYKQVSK